MSTPALSLDNVYKKYCKSLKRSMLYGIQDITKNVVGFRTHSDMLRKGEFWAVKNVCFTIEEGKTIGIVGPNGSGKTTLLKMLSGIFYPDKGRITISGRVGALIELGAGFHPLLTGRENIFVNGAIMGMTKLDIKRKFDEIVDFADIGDFLDVPVKHYSSGMFVKLGFAIAINCEPDILLIDEVLAVGDKGFQAKCFNKLGQLKRKGLTTILVSHNMHAISTFSDKALLLKEGEAKYFDKPSEGVKQYSRLFFKSGDDNVEKILSGNEHIDFFDVILNKKVFTPGDSLEILLCYRSSIHYNSVEIDTGIYTNNEIDLYFQATNRTYDKVVDLLAGSYQLRITIKNISINDALATFAIAIWSNNREEKLFWWRIPITFESIDQSTGKNFLRMEYAIEQTKL